MKKKIKTVLFFFCIILMCLLATIIRGACDWFKMRFGVSFEEILFTITSPLEGSDTSFLREAVEYILPDVFLACLIIILVVLGYTWLSRRIQIDLFIGFKKHEKKLAFPDIYHASCWLFAVIFLLGSLYQAVKTLEIDDYITRRMDQTTLYEDYYVDPGDVAITGEDTKNIIVIYLESMETTYASTDLGGFQDVNYIPNLTELAQSNISFSSNSLLGGTAVTSGAGWTMGALFASTSGLPFSFSIDGNSMNSFEHFASGVTSLGDILEQKGYLQVFLCGSDGTFAGRQNYFEQHGNYDVIDYYDFIEKGYIDEDYYVWWGAEDEILYEAAKTELLTLSQQGAPFNFTMLTADTHHVEGYLCDICGDAYDSQLANVVACADSQVYDFISWCSQQDFYDDTVILITGDHLRMDSYLVADAPDRKVYNCFINSAATLENSSKNRVFTTMDLFPTTLAAMGFEIEGNRLGIGTNLFSAESTLAEEMGFDAFNGEIGKYSAYFNTTFR